MSDSQFTKDINTNWWHSVELTLNSALARMGRSGPGMSRRAFVNEVSGEPYRQLMAPSKTTANTRKTQRHRSVHFVFAGVRFLTLSHPFFLFRSGPDAEPYRNREWACPWHLKWRLQARAYGSNPANNLFTGRPPRPSGSLFAFENREQTLALHCYFHLFLRDLYVRLFNMLLFFWKGRLVFAEKKSVRNQPFPFFFIKIINTQQHFYMKTEIN